MTILSEKTIPVAKAYIILMAIFPDTLVANALAILRRVVGYSEDIMIGTLFDIVFAASGYNDHETFFLRLIGQLCAERVGTYEEIEDLSKETVTAAALEAAHKKSNPAPEEETYHMLVCHCQYRSE